MSITQKNVFRIAFANNFRLEWKGVHFHAATWPPFWSWRGEQGMFPKEWHLGWGAQWPPQPVECYNSGARLRGYNKRGCCMRLCKMARLCARLRVFALFCAFLCFFFLPKRAGTKAQTCAELWKTVQKQRFYAIPPLVYTPFCVSPNYNISVSAPRPLQEPLCRQGVRLGGPILALSRIHVQLWVLNRLVPKGPTPIESALTTSISKQRGFTKCSVFLKRVSLLNPRVRTNFVVFPIEWKTGRSLDVRFDFGRRPGV